VTVIISRQDGEGLTFDASPSRTYRKNYNVTDHPVEEGADVTDHVQQLPLEYTVTGIVSGTPFESAQNADSEFRTLEALEFLEQTADAGEVVTVLDDRLGLIQDVVIASVPTQVDVQRRLQFEVKFRRVVFAEAQRVEIPPDQPDPVAQASAPDEQDVGSQPTQEPGSGASDDEGSPAENIGEGVFDIGASLLGGG